jgi:hypothetical protein
VFSFLSVLLIVMNKPSSLKNKVITPVSMYQDNQVLRKAHRAIMPCYISRLLQLCKDVLGEDFTKLDSHLIYDMVMSEDQEKRKKMLPNELIPQTTPCTKILCSYNAINAPITPKKIIQVSAKKTNI